MLNTMQSSCSLKSVRVARVAALILGLLGLARSARAQDTPTDVVYLKDGTRVHGRVVSEGDDAIVVDTSGGRVTIPRERVRHVGRSEGTPTPNPAAPALPGASADASPSAIGLTPPPDAPAPPPAWRAPSLIFAARLEGSWMFKNYDLRDPTLGERGGGGGLGLEASYLHAFVDRGLAPIWFGLEAGASLGVHYIAYSQDGVPAGALGANKAGLQNGETTFFELEPGLFAGARVGFGAIERGSVFYGGSIGLGVAPTVVVIFPNDQQGGSGFNPAGIRASIDLGRFDAANEDRQVLVRLTFLWLPYLNSLPSMGSAGLGVVLY